MDKLVTYFEEKINLLSMDTVIMLDSLDQLSPENGAHKMSWLPSYVPDNVKIVVSTLPGEEYKVMPNLKV